MLKKLNQKKNQRYSCRTCSANATREKGLIKPGGVRKKLLKKSEEIILTLYYLHHVPTFQMLGINFGVSESTANNIFHYWIDILQELLPNN